MPSALGTPQKVMLSNLPTVLTTSLGQGLNGPLILEVRSLFTDVPVIDRPGIISAWDDPAFIAAIERTGRKNLIMARSQSSVCLAFAAMQAVDAGLQCLRRGRCLRRA